MYAELQMSVRKIISKTNKHSSDASNKIFEDARLPFSDVTQPRR